uniref:Uncharacterized protein n=1 Tax=Tanacetum cinerariifolium TaxID=118510 RepID=A0A6L2LFB1_TANCI|nr:hypothetical protein [Tanacetum cinerariifolium]
MVERDDEIKVLGEIKIELESRTHKVIGKLIQEKVSQQEALEKFKWTVVRDHEIKVLGEINMELESGNDFYGLMYDTDDDASISGKSCEHFGWDWDSPGTEVDWQDDPLHETEDLFVGLDQPIQLVVSQNNVHEGVAEEVIEIANDQAEALSSDKEVTDDCLDDEHVEKSRPSKRIRVTKKEMVKDQKSKKV